MLCVLVGAAAIFGGTYAHGFVTDQLEQEKITMPTSAAISALDDQTSRDVLSKWEGQPLTTGPQAKAYADNFIWQHMKKASNGRTYQQLGDDIKKAQSEGKSQDEIKKLQDTRTSSFQGDSLRGILLSAYGWWLVGSIALWAGIALAVIGVILLALAFTVLRPRQESAA